MLVGRHMRDSAQGLAGQEQNTGRSRSPTLKPEVQEAPYFGKTLHDHLLHDYLANRFMRQSGVEGSGLRGGPITWWAAWRQSLLQ